MRPHHILVPLMFACLLPVPSSGQPTATDLSYYPLQVGNIWMYREYQWTPQGTVATGVTVRTEIVGIEQRGNGRQYAVFDRGLQPTRVDSVTGLVFSFDPYPGVFTPCADSMEAFVVDLTVDSATGYPDCGPFADLGGWLVRTVPSRRVGQLYISRPQRIWESWLRTFEYAEGIGLCRYSGAGYTDKIYELMFARIGGTDYYPVSLRSFTGDVVAGKGVLLRWETESEIGNLGFSIERRSGASPDWQRLAFIAASAREGGGAAYRYEDATAVEGTMYYRLCQQDIDGTAEYSPEIAVTIAGAAPSARVIVWPDPAVDAAMIRVTGVQASGRLLITDILGREIRHYDVTRDRSIAWDLRDAGGHPVPAGVYLLQLLSGDHTDMRFLRVGR